VRVTILQLLFTALTQAQARPPDRPPRRVLSHGLLPRGGAASEGQRVALQEPVHRRPRGSLRAGVGLAPFLRLGVGSLERSPSFARRMTPCLHARKNTHRFEPNAKTPWPCRRRISQRDQPVYQPYQTVFLGSEAPPPAAFLFEASIYRRLASV